MMKPYVLLIFIVLAAACSTPQSADASLENETINEVTYDSAYAAELGADVYGMKQYVVAFLKTGPNKSKDSTEAANLQAAHLANIRRLAEDGKLVLVGPFMDNTELRGMYVFDVESVDEAKALSETDPGVQKGVFVMEYHPWYGTAAIQEIMDIHSRIARENP